MATPTKVIKVVTSGPAGQAGPKGDRGIQGPSGSADGSFVRTGDSNLYYEDGNVGLGSEFSLIDPSAKLEIRQSQRDAELGPGTDLFLVKSFDTNTNQLETRFVVNAQGVTVLGAFVEAPAAVTGGMYYNADGSVYLGFE